MSMAPAQQLTTSAGLAHYPTVWYNRNALDVLRLEFHFREATEPETVPLGVGKTVQWFRPTVMAANTTPSAEGVIGNSLSLSTTTVSATVQEFSDFISGSTLLVETDITETETMHAKELGYRGGLSVDTLVRLEIDSNTAAFTNSSASIPGTLGATATLQDVRARMADLAAINVKPKTGQDFLVLLHSYVEYDIKADNTAGGFIDIGKYIAGEKLMDNEIGRIAGARFVRSNNVGTSGSSPNVLYNMYVFGKGGVGAVTLSGRGPSDITDPTKQNFNVAVIRGGKPAIYDPEGKIGFVASYRFVFAVKTLDTTNYRYRVIPCDASLV